MTYAQLEDYFSQHLAKEKSIWEECRQKIIKKYMDQGYWMSWAEAKAEHEVWGLRSGKKE